VDYLLSAANRHRNNIVQVLVSSYTLNFAGIQAIILQNISHRVAMESDQISIEHYEVPGMLQTTVDGECLKCYKEIRQWFGFA